MLGEGTVWYLSICRHKNRDGNRISEIFPASRRMVEMVLVLTATKLGVTELQRLLSYLIILLFVVRNQPTGVKSKEFSNMFMEEVLLNK